MDVRTFDVWVHHRDITSPLGLSTNDGGPAAEAVLDQVHNSLGYIVGKKIGMPDGSSIEINVSGPIERTLAAVVDGRAQVVESVESPTVTLDAEALSFIQLACGRIDPEVEIAAGRIRWCGDEELGAKAARSLAFTR